VTRFVIACLMLAATGAYVLTHPPENLAVGHGPLAACPAVFDGWNGTDLSFADAVVEDLRADDLLIRRYQRGDDRVWLCIVYHRHRRYGAHDPRLCFESQGYLIEQPGRTRVADGRGAALEVNRFVASRGRDRRVVYYWWMAPGLATSDAGAFRRALALRNTLDPSSWGAFVRIESQLREDDRNRAESAAADFAARVVPVLPGVLGAQQP